MSNVHAEQDNTLEDGYGQIVKSNALTSLWEVLGINSWILQCCALEVIIALAKYGKIQI
jgi:hypothetical protein